MKTLLTLTATLALLVAVPAMADTSPEPIATYRALGVVESVEVYNDGSTMLQIGQLGGSIRAVCDPPPLLACGAGHECLSCNGEVPLGISVVVVGEIFGSGTRTVKGISSVE